MDRRKSKVLQFVVESYVARPEPVGSRTISRQLPLGLSPATIRNEMADLEELGYLVQPHPSAGRIPSDRGYRFYVDYLMEKACPAPGEALLIRKAYERKVLEAEWVVRQAARLISEITNYASLVIGPNCLPGVCRGLKVVPLEAGQALLVVFGDHGFLESRRIEVPADLSEDNLKEVGRLLSARLYGHTFVQIQRHLLADLYRQLRECRDVLDVCLSALEGMALEEERPYVVGADKILGQPEFQDVGKAKEILEFLGGNDLVAELFAAGQSDGEAITMSIGGENLFPEIRECTLVSTGYLVGLGGGSWKLVVLGPKRMAYQKVVTTLEYLHEQMKVVLGA